MQKVIPWFSWVQKLNDYYLGCLVLQFLRSIKKKALNRLAMIYWGLELWIEMFQSCCFSGVQSPGSSLYVPLTDDQGTLYSNVQHNYALHSNSNRSIISTIAVCSFEASNRAYSVWLKIICLMCFYNLWLSIPLGSRFILLELWLKSIVRFIHPWLLVEKK